MTKVELEEEKELELSHTEYSDHLNIITTDDKRSNQFKKYLKRDGK